VTLAAYRGLSADSKDFIEQAKMPPPAFPATEDEIVEILRAKVQ
jgi:hypothetical protein